MKPMEHQGTMVIETERLLLRPFTIDDAPAAFRNWTSDPIVTTFLRWPTHIDISVSRKVISDWVSRYTEKNFYQWGIVLKENGSEPIGTISVVEEEENLNLIEIGYCIGRKWWHHDITSEAFAALFPFFFEQVGVNRIQAVHDVKNPNSGKVMRKCGLTYEGTLRQSGKNNQGIADIAMYSILAQEWRKRTV